MSAGPSTGADAITAGAHERHAIMTTTLRIDPKKKTFSMSAIARLLHYISHNDAAGVQTEISNGADVNHAEPVRRPLSQSLAARGTDGSGGFGGSPRGRPRCTSRRSRMRAARARATPSRSSSCCSMCASIFAAHFFLRTLSDSLSELAPAGRRAARSTPGTTRATRRCSWPARSAAQKRCSAPEPTQHASTTCGCKPLALVP